MSPLAVCKDASDVQMTLWVTDLDNRLELFRGGDYLRRFSNGSPLASIRRLSRDNHAYGILPVAGWTVCFFAIYLPSALLLVGVLPFWESLRQRAWAQAALKGTNAVVVGLLLAAFCKPVCTVGIHGLRAFLLAPAALILLVKWRCPPWFVVILSAAAGFILL